MKKLLTTFFLLLSALVSADAGAETVTHKEAKMWAQTFFNAARGEVTAPVKMVYNGKDLTTQRLFTPFFIYNSPRGGFVIISGENKMFPILGYCMSGSFDPARMDPAIRALLKEYARQIELIRYDSTVPEQAIEAWRNKNGYINSVINAPVESGFSLPDKEEVAQTFALMMSDLPFDDSLRSDLYTPGQWNDLVSDELRRRGYAVMGIGEEDAFEPLLAVGKTGDYVRFRFAGSEAPWNMLLFPSEVLTGGLIGQLGGEPVWPDEEVEIPFAFHDQIMEMYPMITRAEESRILDSLTPSGPIVRGLGSGHFEIDFPSEIALVRVFSIAGHSVKAQTYAGSTRTAVINIEDQPNGFYVISAQMTDGTPYSLKVAR